MCSAVPAKHLRNLGRLPTHSPGPGRGNQQSLSEAVLLQWPNLNLSSPRSEELASGWLRHEPLTILSITAGEGTSKNCENFQTVPKMVHRFRHAKLGTEPGSRYDTEAIQKGGFLLNCSQL